MVNASNTTPPSTQVPPGLQYNENTIEWHVKLVAHVLILVTSLVGNSLVLAVIRSNKPRRRRKTPYELFIANLSIADLTFILVYFLAIYSDVTSIPFFCIVINPLVTVSSTVSMLTLTAMAGFRCKAIVNPFKAHFSIKTVYVTIVLLWLLGFLCVVPLYLILAVVQGHCVEQWPSQDLNKVYTLALFVVEYVVLMAVIIFSYTRIVFYLRRNKLPQTHLTDTGRVSQLRRKDDQEVSKSLVVIVILYTILTLPHHLGWILSEIFHQREAAAIIFQFSGTLLLAHSCCNPFVYGSFARRFRRGYMRCLTQIVHCGRGGGLGRKSFSRSTGTDNESSARHNDHRCHSMNEKECLTRNTTLRTVTD